MSLHVAVNAAIDGLDLSESDKAAAELALAYARAIDASYCRECEADTSLDTLGPKLLSALEALGATPVARARLLKGGGRDDGPSPLDELRARRAARQRDPAAVDPAAAGADA